MFRWSLVAVDEDGSERTVAVFAESRREAIEKAQDAFWPVEDVRVVSAEEYLNLPGEPEYV